MFKLIDSNGNEYDYKPESINSNNSEDGSNPIPPPHKPSTEKFIGFLEEKSNEDGSSSESDEGQMTEDEKAKFFLRKIHEY